MSALLSADVMRVERPAACSAPPTLPPCTRGTSIYCGRCLEHGCRIGPRVPAVRRGESVGRAVQWRVAELNGVDVERVGLRGDRPRLRIDGGRIQVDRGGMANRQDSSARGRDVLPGVHRRSQPWLPTSNASPRQNDPGRTADPTRHPGEHRVGGRHLRVTGSCPTWTGPARRGRCHVRLRGKRCGERFSVVWPAVPA